MARRFRTAPGEAVFFSKGMALEPSPLQRWYLYNFKYSMMLHAQTGWFWWCYMKHVGCLWSKSSRAASYWNLLNHVRHQSSMWCTRSDSMNCFNRPLLICRRYFWGSCAWMRINSIDMVLLTWSLDAKFGKCAVFPREENPSNNSWHPINPNQLSPKSSNGSDSNRPQSW